ncbi:hypothetical protein DJ021_09330 [Phenylobacterium hankyongense]|uniref:Calcium-binding protein n=1 Tax=Phenylobacterium hankyongense TaxID=1813876 RepID=A0A328AZA6_9CAUL|nr:hypothetical protein [Phenylobacterium hankyongense]RAK59989.1 hypothetical protein DJ021_09330 [Phenylobacterium hankyongense]
MATYIFETMTQADATAFTSTDFIIFQNGIAVGANTSVIYNAATATSTDSVTITEVGGKALTFDIAAVGNRDFTIYQDGSKLEVGTLGPDTNPAANTTAFADGLYGGNGNDTLAGGAGADLLQGNRGDDSLNGGTGNDSVYGGQGNDTIITGSGSNYARATSATTRSTARPAPRRAASGCTAARATTSSSAPLAAICCSATSATTA